MTWTWEILDSGDIEVCNDSGTAVETIPYGEGFDWNPPEPPQAVYNVVVNNDVAAALSGDIEQATDNNLPSSK